MRKFARVFTSMVALSCLAPNVVFGATGDIYDLRTNIKYSISDSNDKSIFKDNILSGLSKESNLFVEHEDGKLLNYQDMQRAKRQAIIDVLTSHDIDINNPESMSEGIETYKEEILQAQNAALSKLSKKDIPVTSSKPTKDDTALSKLKFDFEESDGIAKFTIREAHSINKSPYEGKFHITAIQNGESVYNENGIKLNQQVTFTYSEDLEIRVKRNPEDTSYVSINLKNRTDDWTITEDSKQDIGIAGNPEDGYTVAWELDLTERNSKGEERKRTDNISLSIVDRVSGEELHNIPVNQLESSVNLSTMDTVDPIVKIVDSTSSKVISDSTNLILNYEIPDKIDLVVDIAQTTRRREINIQVDAVDYVLEDAYIEVRQGDSIVKEFPVNIGNDVPHEYTEGQYTVTAYTNADKGIKLGSCDVDFKWVGISDMVFTSLGVSSDLIPWDPSNPIEMEFKPVYLDSIQTDETFIINVYEKDTEKLLSTQQAVYGDILQIPCATGKELIIEVTTLSGHGVFRTDYILPAYAHIAPSIFSKYDKSLGTLTMQLSPISTAYTVDEYFDNYVTSVRLGCGVSPKLPDLTQIIGEIDKSLFKTGDVVMNVGELKETSTVGRFEIVDKYGRESYIVTGIYKLPGALSEEQDTELPQDNVSAEFPQDNTTVDTDFDSSIDFEEIPEIDSDITFTEEVEESTVAGFNDTEEFDEFVESSINLLNDNGINGDSHDIPLKIETQVLPNINGSKESDEDGIDLEDLDIDDLDFDL